MPSPLRVLHLEDNPRDAEVVRHKLDAEGVPCDILLVNLVLETLIVHFARCERAKSFDAHGLLIG